MISGIYFNGKSSKANACLVHQTDESIYIYFENEPEKNIIWNKVDLHSNDIQSDVLIIQYGDFPHETLEISGEKAIDFFHELHKENPIKQVKGFWLKNKKKSLFYILSSFLALVFLSYFFIIPWLGEKATLLIPKSTEIELGESLAKNIEATEIIDVELSLKLNKFAKQLKINGGYPIKIHVVKSETVNAFAIPGGNVFIYTGILEKMDSYEELVALLGHEITHITHQHSLKSIGRSAASSIFVSSLFGDVGGVTTGIANKADQLKQLGYSRELETEADTEGVEFLKLNHISARGMKNLLTILDDENDNMNGLIEYISSHPDTKKRIKNVSQFNFSFPENEKLAKLFDEIIAEIQH